MAPIDDGVLFTYVSSTSSVIISGAFTSVFNVYSMIDYTDYE